MSDCMLQFEVEDIDMVDEDDCTADAAIADLTAAFDIMATSPFAIAPQDAPPDIKKKEPRASRSMKTMSSVTRSLCFDSVA